MNELLRFQKGNDKLSTKIAVLNLPAGYSCPGAKLCLSKFNPVTRKIEDGKDTQFRCFGAMEERYPAVGAMRWRNWDLLKAAKTMPKMMELISESLPDSDIVRPHSSAGDFYNETYFKAWLNIALNKPDTLFYTYTKSVQFLVKYRDQMPDNFRIVASYGGKKDSLIEEHNLRFAKVFETLEAAEKAGLEVDFDDSHAFAGDKSFALLVHGSQPKGTTAAKASWQNKKVKDEWKLAQKVKNPTKIFVK
jgi:hypothetical protein